MRSAKRTAKLSIVLGGAVNPALNVNHPALESPLAGRVGGWPARSAVLTSSPNQGRQGGLPPNPPKAQPALFYVLGVATAAGFVWWVIFAIGSWILRLAQY